MDRAGVAAVVGLLVWGLSSMLGTWVHVSVRSREHKPNEAEAPPSRRALAWHLVHVRDDIAALVIIGPGLTNGLLAAILVVLVMG